MQQEMDFGTFPESSLLGVQHYLKDIELPTPPLSPEDKVSTDLDTSAPLLPELPPMDNNAELDLDAVFNMAGLDPEEDFNLTFYGSPALDPVSQDLCSILDDKAVLQDCMWGSSVYEPRNIASTSTDPEIYTPAPSPPAEIKQTAGDEADDSCSEGFSSDPSSQERDISPQVFTYGAAAMLMDPNHRQVQPMQLQEEQQQREHEARVTRKKEREERRSIASKRTVLMGINGRRPASADSGSGKKFCCNSHNQYYC